MRKVFLFFVFTVFLLFAISVKFGISQDTNVEDQNIRQAKYEETRKIEINYFRTLKLNKFLSKLDKSFTNVPFATYALKNNNPGNLRHFSKKTGYRYFKSMREGYNALISDLEYKITGRSCHTDENTTISQFVEIYAPRHENNTGKYTSYVCKAMGMHQNDKLSSIKDVHRLAQVIIYMEDQNVYKALYDKDKEFESLMRINDLVYCSINDNVMLATK